MTTLELPSLYDEPYSVHGGGAAYLGDCLDLMRQMEDGSVDLICTSPPFALLRKKQYGNVSSEEYVEWFMRFAKEFWRILNKGDEEGYGCGSLAIDIGGSWVKGQPTRSLYHFELLIRLCKAKDEGGGGFHLAQELYWYNPAKLPTPAQWVTIERIRVKDAVNTVWWLTPTPRPKASNRRVLKPYSKAQEKLMENGYKAKERPSEHNLSDQFTNDNGGAIPPNMIEGGELPAEIGDDVDVERDDRYEGVDVSGRAPVNVIAAANTSSNDLYQRRCKEMGVQRHPARFPRDLPQFLIGLCTEKGDVVLDPFAGSNMTGYVAQKMGRRWLAFETEEEYLEGAEFRFEEFSEKKNYVKKSTEGQKDLFTLESASPGQEEAVAR